MNSKRIRFQTVLLHTLAWIAFLFLSLVLVPTPRHRHAYEVPFYLYIPFIATTISLIIIFYLYYHVFIPRYYFKKRYIVFSLISIGVLFFLMSVTEIDHFFQISPHYLPKSGHHKRPDFGKSYQYLLRFSPFEAQVFFMGLLVIMMSMLLRIIDRLRQVETAKIDAELSFLKAQINPHFLFNTLNSIYSLAYRKSDQTAQALLKLSGMMRYVISEVHTSLVPLQKEIDYVNNYISLQKIRLGDSVQVDYSMDGEPEGKLIAPLLLIPFVENAFKYGVNPESPSTIRILLNITDSSLQFEVENRNLNTGTQPSEGIGIENTKERLELIYPGRHLLNIRKTDEEHYVSLHIYFS